MQHQASESYSTLLNLCNPRYLHAIEPMHYLRPVARYPTTLSLKPRQASQKLARERASLFDPINEIFPGDSGTYCHYCVIDSNLRLVVTANLLVADVHT